ncbi:hypothetical protein [Alteromonas sp. CYL-A6]|uniref:hypothetical protein n=1 Tax=Alteromonas nitratireducens TaxID=3390813 RepID=UPI0034B85E80
MFTKNLRKILGPVAIFAVAISIYVAQTLTTSVPAKSNSQLQSLQCNFINLMCSFTINRQQATAEFTRHPSPEESVTLQISLPDGIAVSSAWIEGVNMYMGKIPVLVDQNTEGQWEGWFMLGSCSEPTMRWRMLLNLEGRETPAMLYFTTDNG